MYRKGKTFFGLKWRKFLSEQNFRLGYKERNVFDYKILTDGEFYL